MNKTVKLIECGAEISSNVTGTAIGFLFGGPAGAIAGAALSPVTKRVVEKIWLSDNFRGCNSSAFNG